jgi:CheY-like chemotaxis protein
MVTQCLDICCFECLLVDDADQIRLIMKFFFSNFGYEVDSARSAEEALALFDPAIHNLVITDNSMPARARENIGKTDRPR